MKETIFFATFSSETATQTYSGNRIQYYKEEKTLFEFWKWVEEERAEIEKKLGRGVIVKSIQIIKSEH